MSERFDTLFAGMSEEIAIKTLGTDPSELSNPGLKYLAATRLGACTSLDSLEQLITAASKDSDNLYERITRRKALDALGRRKNPLALPTLLNALSLDDEPCVVNAADAIARIGSELDPSAQSLLLNALEGPDNQRRAVIQAFTRLRLADRNDAIQQCQQDDNPLVAGAARAHAVRVSQQIDALDPLISQLRDINPGRRRAAVIDLGDAGRMEALPALSRCPVSMPLRAKSAFQIAVRQDDGVDSAAIPWLEQLLKDDPRALDLDNVPGTDAEPDSVRDGLQHRDEARQYAAAVALLGMAPAPQLSLIDALQRDLGSDYGVHYLLASCTGLLGLHERSQLVREAMAETAPQYAKSRVAAAWSCLRLGLHDQSQTIAELSQSSAWKPLRWSCQQVLKQLKD